MFHRGDFRIVRWRSGLALLGLAILVLSFLWLLSRPRDFSPGKKAVKIPDIERGAGLVIIDPGHGGQDSGTIHFGVVEKDLTLDVAKRMERLLHEKSVPTMLTRTDDKYVSLAGRAACANAARDGLFVSIHFDEAQSAAAGVETYYAARQTPQLSLLASWLPIFRTSPREQGNFESQSLAGFVQEQLVAKTQAINRGTRAQQFYVIANVRQPAVLVEGGFLTNKEDLSKLTTESYREQLAAAIVGGVLRYRQVMESSPRALAGTAAE